MTVNRVRRFIVECVREFWKNEPGYPDISENLGLKKNGISGGDGKVRGWCIPVWVNAICYAFTQIILGIVVFHVRGGENLTSLTPIL
jgi:hypothetical protein